MPGVEWVLDEEGHPQRHYESKGATTDNPAQITAARELDHGLDVVLDRAVDLSSRVHGERAGKDFTDQWAIGSVLSESQISGHKALEGEDEGFLWFILAAKTRIGVRSDGAATDAWRDLRPPPGQNKKNREASEKGADHFERSMWLAQQSYADAVMTFGGKVDAVSQMIDRPNLRPLVVREALCGWLGDLSEEGRAQIFRRETFREFMKALRARWPSRGRRSALQPIHLGVDELRAEIARVAWEAGILGTTRDSA